MSRNRRKEPRQNDSVVWRIALYIRLSREDDDFENSESMSVLNQRKILTEYVERHFCEDYSIYDTYVDDGNTGTDIDRPGFKRMENDIKECRVNCVIVKALSRAFRNIGDQSKFLDEFLPLYGVRFISIGSPFVDTFTNPKSATCFEVPMYGLFNEQYAAATSEEVRKTFDTKRRKGEFIGAFAPYGYAKSPENKNKLIIDDPAAAVVCDIFTWFLYGIAHDNEPPKSLSIAGITRELNERGIPSPAMYKRMNGFNFKNPKIKYSEVYWTPVGVSGILKNQVYIGDMVQGKNKIISYKIHKQVRTPQSEWIIVENTHEPIISKETFEAVQKMLTRDTRTPPNNKAIYPFSGFLRCNDCGRSLHRKTAKGVAYYYCRISKEATNKCTRHSIRESRLEEAVLSAIQLQIKLIKKIEKVIDDINKAPKIETKSTRLQSLLKQQENELTRAITLCDSLYTDWKNGDITKEEYQRIKSNYTRRQDDLKSAISKIKADIETVSHGVSIVNPYFQEFMKHKNIQTITRDVLVCLIDVILVHEGGEITIKFNFTDQYRCIVDFIESNGYVIDL